MASYLYESLQPQSQYLDKKSGLSEIEYKKRLETTTTVYVGNLHCNTSESALYELFTRAGQVKDLIMGVTSNGIFAGFCFVIYYTHEEARIAVEYISQTKLYDRVIRVDWDYGFVEGRQFGRGIEGYQKRDQYRQTNDSGRHNIHGKWKEHQQQQQSQSQERPYNNRGGYRGGYNNNYNKDNNFKPRFNNNNQNDRNNSNGGGFNNQNRYKKGYNQFKSEQQKERSNSSSPEYNTKKKRHQEEENED